MDRAGVPSGETERRGAITKTGNTHARRALVEAAWAVLSLPPRIRVEEALHRDRHRSQHDLHASNLVDERHDIPSTPPWVNYSGAVPARRDQDFPAGLPEG